MYRKKKGGSAMRITAITQQKRDPSRYNIFIDGVYAFALPMQDILYFKLKEGQEAAEETIAFIRKNLIYPEYIR